MEKIIISIGKFYVFTPTELMPKEFFRVKGIVFYINKEFPIKQFIDCINAGYYKFREATLDEKEYCYWVFDKTGNTGADLLGLDIFIEFKKNK
jgi:hypothetical protein